MPGCGPTQIDGLQRRNERVNKVIYNLLMDSEELGIRGESTFWVEVESRYLGPRKIR